MNTEKAEQIELDVGGDVSVDVEVENTELEETSSEEDQFKKADNSTQKRIDRLTKKMREAERREAEAISYAKKVQDESQTLKSRMSNLDTPLC